MLKKLVVGTILAGCLLSCGKYADLESKVDGQKLNLPGSADPASVLEGTWEVACHSFNGAYYKRESIYEGSAFMLRETYYRDAECKEVWTGYDTVSYGRFKVIKQSSVGPGAYEADFTFTAPSAVVNYTIFQITGDELRFPNTFTTTEATRPTSLAGAQVLNRKK